MDKKIWLVIVWEDIEPSVIGPFEDDEKRLNAALEFRKREGKDHGLYRLDIKEEFPEISPFSGGELEMEE